MSEEESLNIEGKTVDYKYEKRDIYSVQFYDKNPRIATILENLGGNKTEEAIDEALWSMPPTHDLKVSIETDGGLIHPILVYNDQVLEGNTRLCCYRRLYSDTKDEKWKTIPCHVIMEPLTQTQVYRLLCVDHIEGKNQWDAFEKARLYCSMQDEEGMKIEKIADFGRESVPTIQYRIKAYKLMVDTGVHEKSKYSHFEQIVRSKPIREALEKDPKIEVKLAEKVKDGKIEKAASIRKFDVIFKDKQARKRVFNDGEVFEEVLDDVKARRPMTDTPFMKNVEELSSKLRELQREEREQLKNSNSESAKIERLTKDLVKLCNEMGIKIHIPKKISG